MTPEQLRTRGVRLYGPSLGNASNARVTDGVRKALRGLGMLDGIVPTDAFEDEQSYPGVWAGTGVYFGPYHGVGLLRRGAHQRRFCLVAPNSSWLPRDLYETVTPHAELVAPSHWAAGVIEEQGARHDYHVSVSVWRHGLDEAFVPIGEPWDSSFRDFADSQFRVLHLSSSRMQRKGTVELIEAWGRFCSDPLACEQPQLVVVAPAASIELHKLADRCCPTGTVRFLDQLDATAEKMALFYQQHHAVCQPSRGEGFGMVPLEARACGVPVAMTQCTGHAEHAGDDASEEDRVAVVPIETGEPVAIDDGPGARAPSLDAGAIYEALVELYSSWPVLKQDAMEASAGLRERWSWRVVTERWLRERGLIEGEQSDADSADRGRG